MPGDTFSIQLSILQFLLLLLLLYSSFYSEILIQVNKFVVLVIRQIEES